MDKPMNKDRRELGWGTAILRAADRIEQLIATLADRDATIERMRADYLRLALKAKVVMEMLEEHGPKVVPHLIDTDDNPGQYLRNAIDAALDASATGMVK